MAWIRNQEKKKRKDGERESSSFKRHLLFWARWIKFQWSLKLILIQSIKTIWQWCVYSGVGKLIIWENIFWSLSFPLILTLAHTQTKLYWTGLESCCLWRLTTTHLSMCCSYIHVHSISRMWRPFRIFTSYPGSFFISAAALSSSSQQCDFIFWKLVFLLCFSHQM